MKIFKKVLLIYIFMVFSCNISSMGCEKEVTTLLEVGDKKRGSNVMTVPISQISDIKKYTFKDKKIERVDVENISLKSVINFSLNEKSDVVIDKVGVEVLANVWDVKPPGGLVKSIKLEQDESLRLLEETLQDSFSQRMSLLKEEDRESYKSILISAIKLGKTFSFEIEGENVGFVILRDLEHENVSKTLISWVWSAQNLTKAKKESFRFELMRVLKKQGNNKIVAAIHTNNLPSLFFFLKLGFRPIWLSLISSE